jgi:hypothetical protein
MLDEKTQKLLEKLTAIYAWNSACLERLLRLARSESGEFQSRMQALETLLRQAQSDQPLNQAESGLPSGNWYALYTGAVASDPLMDLLRSEPLLSSSQVWVVEILARLAYTRPDPEFGVQADDAMFMSLLEPVVRNIPVDPQSVLKKDLAKLLELDQTSSEIYELLSNLSKRDDWNKQAAELERLMITANPEARQTDPQPGTAGMIFNQIQEKAPSQLYQNLLSLFEREPLFSTMLGEEVQLYESVKGSIVMPNPPSSPAAGSDQPPTTNPSIEGLASRAVEDAFPGLPVNLVDPVLRAITLRKDVAVHFNELRKFAKLNAFEQSWPELAGRLRAEPATIYMLESQAREPNPETSLPSEQLKLWNRYQDDEKLLNFLRLRPYFEGIDEDELRRYFAVSQPLTPIVPTPPATESTTQLEAAVTTPEESVKEAAYPERTGLQPFTVILRIEDGNNRIEIRDTFEPTSGDLLVSAGELWKILSDFISLPGSPASKRATLETRDAIREAGTILFDRVFQGKLGELLVNALEKPTRILFDIRPPDNRARDIPWECLYIPQRKAHPALDPQNSLIRQVGDARSPLATYSLQAPLKILAVLASPKELMPLDLDRERDNLEKALATYQNRRTVMVNYLEPPTVENLQRELSSFRPHICHFIGHGDVFRSGEPGILLINASGGTTAFATREFGAAAANNGVRVIILNRPEAIRGEVGTNIALANSLVDAGVPAVVTPLHTVTDQASLLFTREFYRSLAEGNLLESCLNSARSRLNQENLDWTAFALFANASDLDYIRLETRQVS